ncbi:MAG: hypothetical protein ONA90_06280, partial [candidate division KSB1 bacterium]|nr:hypothetical protein [candidate division KSB1 bacterium]
MSIHALPEKNRVPALAAVERIVNDAVLAIDVPRSIGEIPKIPSSPLFVKSIFGDAYHCNAFSGHMSEKLNDVHEEADATL